MSPQQRARGSVYLGVATSLFVASGALVGGYWTTRPAVDIPRSDGTAAEAAKPATSNEHPQLRAAVEQALDRAVTVRASGQSQVLRWRELGATLDPDELPNALYKADGARDPLAALRERGSLPIRLDRARALEAIAHIKAIVDRAPLDARLDLENRAVHDDAPGHALDGFASLDRLEAAARSATDEVELVDVPLPARTTRSMLGIEDISHVLGTFKTTFAVSDKDRNFNLKLAASKLNGVVLRPGDEFSFNGVVGDRTEKEGYKIAHVITKGEMVDGLAGGTCQISTTLFGASFFAGLDIVKTTPHSRPSTYVPIGLDSTVVWPNTDLKMKNPYDFPVVIHYRVARGEAVVEILGKERPWDLVAFEREIIEETPFETEERPDDTLPAGYRSFDQAGFPGYKMERYRRFYRDKKLVKSDKWVLTYKPVTEYVRVGTSTDPDVRTPEEEPPHGPKIPKEKHSRIEQ